MFTSALSHGLRVMGGLQTKRSTITNSVGMAGTLSRNLAVVDVNSSAPAKARGEPSAFRDEQVFVAFLPYRLVPLALVLADPRTRGLIPCSAHHHTCIVCTDDGFYLLRRPTLCIISRVEEDSFFPAQLLIRCFCDDLRFSSNAVSI